MGGTNRERSHHSRLDDGCEYAYTVEFDSAELIQKSIAHINEKLFVSELVLCQEKVQIKYALLMLSYPAKASALSSNAA